MEIRQIRYGVFGCAAHLTKDARPIIEEMEKNNMREEREGKAEYAGRQARGERDG